jgi:hypothetical protein
VRTPLVVAHIEDEDPVQVKLAYKFLLRPTAKQAAAFEACLEDHRLLCNAAGLGAGHCGSTPSTARW